MTPRAFNPGADPRRDATPSDPRRDAARSAFRHPGLNAANAAAATNAAQAPSTQFTPNARRFDRQGQAGVNAANDPNRLRALRNQTFANPARLGARSALATTMFRGRFAGLNNINHRQRFHRARVIGWFGPMFWPYAYNDVFDYAFWPYAYDSFWPYAYDDVYGGIFGPYAYGYGGPAGQPPGAPPQQLPPDNEQVGALNQDTQVCSQQAAALTNWPMDRIEEAVQPNPQQIALLNNLTRATGRAVEIMQAACPTQLPNTPTGRLAVTQTRLEAMLRAINTVAPALKAFYESLNDEQRAKFDSFGQERDENLANEERNDLTQTCSERPAVALPVERIEQEVQPDGNQRAALENLAQASARASEMLRANCPAEAALTPIGRVEAMRQRLATTLDGVIMVRPALEAFYGSLTYEQRARFNMIGGEEG